MLFARFLAENDLLMHPDGVAVTLAECDELARWTSAANGFVLAARYAAGCCRKSSGPTTCCWRSSLRRSTSWRWRSCSPSLPVQVFTADDCLGWVYQFWQTEEKDEVNRRSTRSTAGRCPPSRSFSPSTTWCEFLLHNTIGAWWCSLHGIQGIPGGAGVPEGKCPARLDYLRWSSPQSDSDVAQPPSAGFPNPQTGDPSALPLARPAKSETRRNLPHLQTEGKTYFVTFCTLSAGHCPRKFGRWSCDIPFMTTGGS